MLNKISNINAGQDFRKSTKFRQFKRYMDGELKHHQGVHDSINISPALNFFDNSGWQLKNIIKSSEDNIQIEFRIDDYNFSVHIDETNLGKMSYMKFFTSKIDLNKINQIIQIEVTVELTDRLNLVSYNNLSMLDMLFARISKFNVNSEIKKEETTQMNIIIEGLLVGLHQEYLAISNVILNFVEKYRNIKVDLKNTEKPLFENHIIIDKINILNA